MAKVKLKSSQVSKAKGQLKKLIEDILKNHKRSKKTYKGVNTLTKGTGNLFREIQPNFVVKEGKIVMEVYMMDYYKYLDEGTKTIEPWFFSEEIMDSAEISKITEDLVLGAVEGQILDIFSKLKK
jgi:hypothetical protein